MWEDVQREGVRGGDGDETAQTPHTCVKLLKNKKDSTHLEDSKNRQV